MVEQERKSILMPVDELLVGDWCIAVEADRWKSMLFAENVILSAEAIQKLKKYSISSVWIDENHRKKLLKTVEAPKPGLNKSSVVKKTDAAASKENEASVQAEQKNHAPLHAAPKLSHESARAAAIAKAVEVKQEGAVVVADYFHDVRMGKLIDSEKAIKLVSNIQDGLAENKDAFLGVLRLKKHDEYTYLHSVAVSALMITLSEAAGFDKALCHEAGLAGLMHDVGKAFSPLDVLNKNGALSDDEFKIMRRHPEDGYNALKEIGAVSEAALDVILHHHEKMNGTGYPHKLPGEQISALSRMGAICDVYDAITSNRPYKKAWGPAESLKRMMSWDGHFDPVLFKMFIRTLGIYPTGSLVRLQSDRLGVVIEQNEGALLKPKIRVFFNAKKREALFVKDVDLADPLVQDAIVGVEPWENWKFNHLDKLWSGLNI